MHGNYLKIQGEKCELWKPNIYTYVFVTDKIAGQPSEVCTGRGTVNDNNARLVHLSSSRGLFLG
ncbi:hypothetical protein SCA6_008555 [Theobroma cacao]